MGTASAIYDRIEDATAAVERVRLAGIPDDDISILTNDPATSRHAGDATVPDAAAGGTVGLLAGLGLVTVPGLGPLVGAGWLAASALVAGAGIAGGLIGGLVGAGHGEDEAHAYAEGLRRGGTMVNVRVPDADQGKIQVLLDSGAYPLDRRSAGWRSAGWTGRYDEMDFQ
jgi:hypothetical protein